MSIMPTPVAVLLPGTGSDDVFVRAVFAGPLAEIGVELVTPPPPPGDCLAAGYLAALDEVSGARKGGILVGGISFGAHLGAEWAVRNPDRTAGLLVALPAWNGAPGDAPASLAAKLSADEIRREGVSATLTRTSAGVAPWLGEELDRAWRRHGDQLAAGLEAAAGHPAPTLAELAGLDVPAGVATCVDDPVHPAAVARAWASALPRAELGETTLNALGADRESLGRTTLHAYLRTRTP
jgi:pimeloyl-ACP methyl ester carboxylesterase